LVVGSWDAQDVREDKGAPPPTDTFARIIRNVLDPEDCAELIRCLNVKGLCDGFYGDAAMPFPCALRLFDPLALGSLANLSARNHAIGFWFSIAGLIALTMSTTMSTLVNSSGKN
jgi:hypothetical protein